jgi:RNA polymerase sigma-70 factor (ECF subfamily)
MAEPQDQFLPTRRSLLTRLKSWDDQEGWRVFFDTYWKLIYGVARKAGLTETEAQDVVQETVLSVAKQMQGFRYDPAIGSFKSWLLLITRRRIADFLRRRYRDALQTRAPDESEELDRRMETLADPAVTVLESIWEEEWRANLIEAAVDRVRRKVDPLQFQLFDCYVLKQWTPSDVTRALGVSVGQVYLAKHRVGSLIRKEIERLEREMV